MKKVVSRISAVAKPTVRVLLGDAIAIGPGKAALLDAVGRTGSISAAAREMGMSYRRAWLLVDTMNRCFRQPLVEKVVGGGGGGGALLTAFGESVLRQYRALESKAAAGIESEFADFSRLLSSPRRRP